MADYFARYWDANIIVAVTTLRDNYTHTETTTDRSRRQPAQVFRENYPRQGHQRYNDPVCHYSLFGSVLRERYLRDDVGCWYTELQPVSEDVLPAEGDPGHKLFQHGHFVLSDIFACRLKDSVYTSFFRWTLSNQRCSHLP
jgi:hypothetical protein